MFGKERVDLRVGRTRHSLQQALQELMEQKLYRKIKVLEGRPTPTETLRVVASEAGLASRATLDDDRDRSE